MNQSLPLNDFGNSILAENCPKIAVEKVLRQSYDDWKQQLSANGSIDIADTPVQLIHSKLAHGGLRLWFACPQCTRRCGVLHQHPLTGQIGCRLCLGLKYKKQRYKGMVETQ